MMVIRLWTRRPNLNRLRRPLRRAVSRLSSRLRARRATKRRIIRSELLSIARTHEHTILYKSI